MSSIVKDVTQSFQVLEQNKVINEYILKMPRWGPPIKQGNLVFIFRELPYN